MAFNKFTILGQAFPGSNKVVRSKRERKRREQTKTINPKRVGEYKPQNPSSTVVIHFVNKNFFDTVTGGSVLDSGAQPPAIVTNFF